MEPVDVSYVFQEPGSTFYLEHVAENTEYAVEAFVIFLITSIPTVSSP